MIKLFFIIFSKFAVVFIFYIALMTTASAAPPAFTDNFKGGLKSGWEWIREIPSEWRITSEGLEVLSNGGHLYKHRPNPSPNILVRKINTNGVVDISVNAEVNTSTGVQGGLILYNDDDNYIKLVIEEISPPNTTHLVMLRESKGVVNHFHHQLRDDPGDDEIKVSIGAGTNNTYEFDLRLVLDNNRVNMFWRSPGAGSWNKINESMPLPNKGGQWYAGILTSGGPSSFRLWQKYSNFSLNSETTNTPSTPTSETDVAPKIDVTPAVDVTPEVNVTPKTDVIPVANATPKVSVPPKTDATPKVGVTPKADVIPQAEVTPEVGTTPKADITLKADEASPAITLNGTNPASVILDTEYTDAGATASTKNKADESISVSNDALTAVNTAIEGSYTVTFTATDTAGNSSTATRIVNVVETLAIDGLSAYWSLDENSGLTAKDQSSHGNHLSLLNMSESNWVDGQFSSALDFNGFFQDVALPNATQALQTESITLSAWVNPDETTRRWEWVSAQGDNYGLFLQPNNRSVIFYIKKVGRGWDHVSSSRNSFEFNQWQHLAGSFDANTKTLKMFINGIEVNSVTVNQGIGYNTGNGFTIGSMQGGRYFDGAIDEIRVYDSALTDEEMSQLGSKSASETVTIAPSPMKILPLGDSITDSIEGNPSYRRSLWQQLNSAGYDVDFVGRPNYRHTTVSEELLDYDLDHEGHSGWEANQIEESISAWLNHFTTDIVLLHIGTNDLDRGLGRSEVVSDTINQTLTEIDGIIQKLRAQNSSIVILLAKLIPMRNYDTAVFNSKIDAFVSARTTTASPIVIVDQYTGFDANADTYDNYHPNAAGESKMADKWFKALQPFL